MTQTDPQRVAPTEGPIGRRNVVWGWATMVLGALSGSILMAWSFDGPFPAPSGFTDYAELPRRLTRLAHVALFALPLINVVFGKNIDQADLPEAWKQAASWLAIVGMIGIPFGLLCGALIHVQLKYVSALPVFALMTALAILAGGKVRQHRR